MTKARRSGTPTITGTWHSRRSGRRPSRTSGSSQCECATTCLSLPDCLIPAFCSLTKLLQSQQSCIYPRYAAVPGYDVDRRPAGLCEHSHALIFLSTGSISHTWEVTISHTWEMQLLVDREKNTFATSFPRDDQSHVGMQLLVDRFARSDAPLLDVRPTVSRVVRVPRFPVPCSMCAAVHQLISAPCDKTDWGSAGLSVT